MSIRSMVYSTGTTGSSGTCIGNVVFGRCTLFTTGGAVVPSRSFSLSKSVVSHRTMTNRLLMMKPSSSPQRRSMIWMKTNHQQHQHQHQHQQHQQLLRWNSNITTNNNNHTMPIGRPPSPRVYPSATSSSSTTGTGTGTATATAAATTTTTSTTKSSTSASLYTRTKNRGPVSWTSLFIITIAAASAVTYYQIERERRLERAMGKIVSSEYNGTISTTGTASSMNNNSNMNNKNDEDGWTPRPGYLAKRKFVATPSGWFPVDDGFGAPGKPAIGGPWSLVDLEGNLVTNTNFEGKWILLYFGFARCPDICPSEMMKVGRVMDTLKKDYPIIAKNIVPIFVSIDPARDSLKALKEYAKDFHPDYIFLTGTPQQVKQMAKCYRVYFSKADESVDGDYLVDHSIVIYFHDTTGDLADCFTQSMRPSDVVEKIVERYNAAMKSATTAVTA